VSEQQALPGVLDDVVKLEFSFDGIITNAIDQLQYIAILIYKITLIITMVVYQSFQYFVAFHASINAEVTVAIRVSFSWIRGSASFISPYLRS
jgi:hypothetical protein